MIQFIFIVSIASFFGLIFLFAYWKEQLRLKSLRECTEAMGLEFLPQLPTPDVQRFNRFPFSQSGRGQLLKQAVIAETEFLRMTLFDFTYTTGSGKNQHSHSVAILLATSPDFRLPALNIEPEHWGHRLANFFGQKDIAIEDDPEFSKQFRITGGNEQAVREFLTPSRRQAWREHTAWKLQTNNDAFIIFQGHSKLDASNVPTMMAAGLAVANLLGLESSTNENSSSV